VPNVAALACHLAAHTHTHTHTRTRTHTHTHVHTHKHTHTRPRERRQKELLAAAHQSVAQRRRPALANLETALKVAGAWLPGGAACWLAAWWAGAGRLVGCWAARCWLLGTGCLHSTSVALTSTCSHSCTHTHTGAHTHFKRNTPPPHTRAGTFAWVGGPLKAGTRCTLAYNCRSGPLAFTNTAKLHLGYDGWYNKEKQARGGWAGRVGGGGGGGWGGRGPPAGGPNPPLAPPPPHTHTYTHTHTASTHPATHPALVIRATHTRTHRRTT
jgi:hypothetical protein